MMNKKRRRREFPFGAFLFAGGWEPFLACFDEKRLKTVVGQTFSGPARRYEAS
jgi:hypothetical protein